METLVQRSVKGSSWLIVSRLISVVFGAFATVFIVRWLGPQQYGYLPLISSILGVAMIFGDAGLGPSTAYFLAQHQENRKYSYELLYKTLNLRILVFLPICMVFLYIMPYISIILEAPLLKNKLAATVTLLFFIQVMSRWTGKAYEGLGDAGSLGKIRAYVSWVSPLSQVLLVASGWGVFGVISGQVFGNAIAVAMLIFFLFRKYKSNIRWRIPNDISVSYSQIIRYALPLMVIHASFFVYLQSDILLLKYFRDIQQVS